MTSTTTVGQQEFMETVGEYKWTLKNFSSFRKENGDYISSPIFSNPVIGSKNDMKWQLDLYPNGFKEHKGYISIFLRSLNDISITVGCEFTISSSTKIYFNKKFSTLIERKSDRGFRKCIHRATLLHDLEKENDKLIVISKIIFSNSIYETNSQLNLIEDLALLLKMGEHCDVTLIASDGIQFKAHKLVLMCRSKVFSAMLEHNMKESQDNIVKIEDVDSETLKVMLQFIYTGKMKCIQNREKKILIAADKYELNDLRSMCAYHISENLSKHNILDWIEIAHTYNIEELKLKAKRYYLKNRKVIMSIEGHQKVKILSRDILEDLLCDVSTYDDETE